MTFQSPYLLLQGGCLKHVAIVVRLQRQKVLGKDVPPLRRRADWLALPCISTFVPTFRSRAIDHTNVDAQVWYIYQPLWQLFNVSLMSAVLSVYRKWSMYMHRQA